MGGDASRNGAELFETEADFSAKIVTFRLVGGNASPPSPPPKSATAYEAAAYYLPQKRASFAFFYKTRADTQQVLPAQTGLYRPNE